MKHLLCLAFAGAMLHAQTVTITDTITTPMGGNWAGTVAVSLNNPQAAQPLYTGTTTLSGWAQTVTVTNGAFTLTLYRNDTITPAGTSYTARYTPTSGSAWSETWVVPAGATKIREIRATTVPRPTVIVTPAQISGAAATSGQALVWNGSSWAPATVGGGTVYVATAVIDLVPVPDGTCVLDSTAVTVTGAALGGRPTIGASFQPPEGVQLTAKVIGPNSMKVEICNHSGASYNATSATYYFGVAQ
jgi:hypothetical protein